MWKKTHYIYLTGIIVCDFSDEAIIELNSAAIRAAVKRSL